MVWSSANTFISIRSEFRRLGGLSAEERRAGEEAGLVAVRLGPRVLRTETAALAALAALNALRAFATETDDD